MSKYLCYEDYTGALSARRETVSSLEMGENFGTGMEGGEDVRALTED